MAPEVASGPGPTTHTRAVTAKGLVGERIVSLVFDESGRELFGTSQILN